MGQNLLITMKKAVVMTGIGGGHDGGHGAPAGFRLACSPKRIAMKRLLVPVDFTPLARHAFDHALVIAEALSGEVILLHAVHVPDAVPSGTGAEDAWMERERDRSAAELEAFLMAGNPRTSVPVSSCLVEDYPEDGIVSWAARKGAPIWQCRHTQSS